MEKAVFISKIKDLGLLGKNRAKYTRLYFGNEFCERLIPPPKDIKEVLDFASENGFEFSFVTPYVTNKGIQKLLPLLKIIKKDSKYKKKSYEIVINDYGVLSMLKKKNMKELKPVIGRLLTKQMRDPRIMNVKKKLSKETLEHFQQSNASLKIFQAFLYEKGVERVELDNILQGIKDDFSIYKIKGSLYYPYVYASTSRFCLAKSCKDKNGRERLGISMCGKECQDYTFKLKNKSMPIELLMKGNTIFFKNYNLHENLEKQGINRLVFMPTIPL